MGNLFAITFDAQFKVDLLWDAILRLQREGLVDVEEAATAVKTSSGEVQLRRLTSAGSAKALHGGLLGLLVGALFLNPVLGAVAGAAGGLVMAALTHAGVSEEFISKLTASLAPGKAVLFVLTRQPSPDRDKVLAELRGFGGDVIHATVSADDAAALQAALKSPKTDA